MITFKRSMLLLLSLISYNAQSLALGEEQREILYTLYEMGQDFASVPMIAQNIDMFIGVIEMEIQLLQRKLLIEDQKVKNAFIQGFGVAGIAGLIQFAQAKYFPNCNFNVAYLRDLTALTRCITNTLATIASSYSGISIFDTIKNRNSSRASLELNKAVLEKLEEVKYMVAQNPQFMANPSIEALESPAENIQNQVE